MNIETHEFYSHHLGKDIIFKRYGHSGKPIIVFPSSGGSYHEFEDFGMIDSISWFINEGYVQVFTPDSVDKEAFLADGMDPKDRPHRQNQYYKYIIDELIGHIKTQYNYDGGFIASGCSMGGYHSLNIFLKHPDAFDTVIALSGVYDARVFVGEYGDDFGIYEHSPVDYIWDQNDPWFIDHYRQGNIIVVVGQGQWEEDSIRDMKKMEEAFKLKEIPAWFDYWGYDVDHDWPWWKIQLPYYLGHLKDQGLL